MSDCIKCPHKDNEHDPDDKGECLVDNCNCNGIES